MLSFPIPSREDHLDATAPKTVQVDKMVHRSTTVPQRSALTVAVMTGEASLPASRRTQCRCCRQRAAPCRCESSRTSRPSFWRAPLPAGAILAVPRGARAASAPCHPPPSRPPLAPALAESAVHLTPVGSLLQMRPDLGYIDAAASAAAAADAASSGETKSPTRVQAQARRRAEGGISQRRMTLPQLAQAREAEPERELRSIVADTAAVDRALLDPSADDEDPSAEAPDSAPSWRATGARSYVEALAVDAAGAGAGRRSGSEAADALGAKHRRGGEARRLAAVAERLAALEERGDDALMEALRRYGGVVAKVPGTVMQRASARVRASELLRRGGAVPCARAMAFVRDRVAEQTAEEADKAAVEHLRRVGRMVRGCWTMRSEVRFAINTALPALATPELATRRQAVWDLVLGAFHEAAEVDRVALCAAHGVPQGTTREDFEAVAVRRDTAAGRAVWVWRWEADGVSRAEAGSDVAAAGTAVRLASDLDGKWWRRRNESLAHVLRPGAAEEGGADLSSRDVGEDSEDGEETGEEDAAAAVPPASSSSSSSSAAPADEVDVDAQADDGPGSASERELALSAAAAVFERRDKARKSDVKAEARAQEDGAELPDAVAIWALDQLGDKLGSRGGYYAARRA